MRNLTLLLQGFFLLASGGCLEPAHPESPQRLRAIEDHLLATGLDFALRHYWAPKATRKQLLRVHDADYVGSIIERAPQEGVIWLDPDTGMMHMTLSAALHAAGVVVLVVDLVMEGRAAQAFCCFRPPGHHAEHNRAMGFSLRTIAPLVGSMKRKL